jgi:hypothetical protein
MYKKRGPIAGPYFFFAGCSGRAAVTPPRSDLCNRSGEDKFLPVDINGRL